MRKQLFNIFLILLVALGVFTLFWKPARKPGTRKTLSVFDHNDPAYPKPKVLKPMEGHTPASSHEPTNPQHNQEANSGQ
jgi:hypothetical protein